MKYLFSPAGRKRLSELIPGKVLLAFDFDGTLSPIVSRPEKATLSARTRQLLRKLADQHPLAVISGRQVSDLELRLGFHPRYLIGNHGMEGLPHWKNQMRKAARICTDWRNQIESHPEDLPLHSGVFLENKVLSLSLHYRNSPKKHVVRRNLLQLIRGLQPLPRLIPGKSVLNLIPDGSPHKGMAFLELMKKAKASKALYVGDDDTDEDVFRLGAPGVVTIRIGQKKGSKAEFYLRNQSEMIRLLQELQLATQSL